MFSVLYVMLIIILPLSKCTLSGRFFWKPRLAIDLHEFKQVYPGHPKHEYNRHNVEDGSVVLITGYNVGITVMALASEISDAGRKYYYPHLTPNTANYYNNVYRWALRYLSLLPGWLASRTSGYAATHQVWKARFYYMNNFVPKWLRPLLPFIGNEEWDREEEELKRYDLYAAQTFGRHYVFPPKDVRE